MGTPKLSHFIHGQSVAGSSGRFGDVFDPATGQVSAQVPLASRAEVEAAIASAEAAFPGWAGTTPLNRARVMFRFKALLEQYEKAPDVTRQRLYLETIGEVLPQLGGKVILDADAKQFLPLMNLRQLEPDAAAGRQEAAR